MRVLDLYIGRFAHNRASTTFISQVLFISACMSGKSKFIEQGKGH